MCKQPDQLALSKTVVRENDRHFPSACIVVTADAYSGEIRTARELTCGGHLSNIGQELAPNAIPYPLAGWA